MALKWVDFWLGYGACRKGRAPTQTHKVDVAFDAEHTEVASKRKKLDMSSGGTIQTARHRSWLLRGRSSQASWRPAQVNRVASKRWLTNVDNAIMRSTCLKAGV